MRSAHIFSVIKGTLNSMKVLVLGPGGREHAIIRALLRDPEVTEVHSGFRTDRPRLRGNECR